MDRIGEDEDIKKKGGKIARTQQREYVLSLHGRSKK
jgi:hypothetical protein